MFALLLGSVPTTGKPRFCNLSTSLSTISQLSPFRFSHYVIVGDANRGIFLIFSILFSATLQRFLSHRYFVFLGNISFPLYLIHGTFIRIPLQWAVIWMLPRLGAP